ncbi:MAG: M28 family peptidase [Traorella sp.]
MKELSKKVFNEYQVRKTYQQKSNFIKLIENEFNEKIIHIEKEGPFKTRNIIIGDIEKSKYILSAHYDTQPVLPFPNFLTPKNLLIYILFNLLLIFVFISLQITIESIVLYFTDNILLSTFIGLFVCFFLIGYMFIGKANKHTANDNTSGVLTLLEVLQDDELSKQVTCVFFDHEEVGLLGSSYFNKRHKELLKNKVLINFDCVGDGDTIMLILSKSMLQEKEKLQESFQSEGNKSILITKSKTTLYPSDQMNFKNHIGVASFKKNKILGYYIDKIHTKHDTHLDETNIKIIIQGLKKYIK